jgi:hypothetical protein
MELVLSTKTANCIGSYLLLVTPWIYEPHFLPIVNCNINSIQHQCSCTWNKNHIHLELYLTFALPYCGCFTPRLPLPHCPLQIQLIQIKQILQGKVRGQMSNWTKRFVGPLTLLCWCLLPLLAFIKRQPIPNVTILTPRVRIHCLLSCAP